MRNRKLLRSQLKKTGQERSRRCRKCQQLRRNQRNEPTKLQVVSAMYAYLMTSWEELPIHNKQALGYDFVVGSEGEEAALNHLARLFIDYADLSFRRALVARRRRLGIDE